MSPMYPGSDGYMQMYAPPVLGSQTSTSDFPSPWGFYGTGMSIQERETYVTNQRTYATYNQTSDFPERRVESSKKKNKKARSSIGLECPSKKRRSESLGPKHYTKTPLHGQETVVHCPDPPFWREKEYVGVGTSRQRPSRLVSTLQDPHDASRGTSRMNESEDDQDSRYESKLSSAREHIMWSRKHRADPVHRSE